MNLDAQTIATMLLVGGAVAYLTRRCHQFVTRASKPGCGPGSGCHGCNSGQLVDLDLPNRKR